MDNALKLSVVVSCYKQENYVAACLDSILNQEVDFNYEIIVADDCSPDNTRKIIKEIHNKYPEKIKLLFQEKNVGAARNYIDVHNLAKGEYVAHFDGDDVMLPGKLQAQVNLMDANSECHIVLHRARYFSDDGRYISETGNLFAEDKTIFFSPKELARWGTIAVHSSYMYRRSTRKTRHYQQDFMEWYLAFESLLSGGVGAYLNKIYVEYRCNPNGGAYLATKAGQEKSYLIIIRNVSEYFISEPAMRCDLYAQQLVNVMMYIKNIRKIKWFMLSFLLRNILYFRLGKFAETVTVRKMVGPSKKIR